jgi:hypothetical protein
MHIYLLIYIKLDNYNMGKKKQQKLYRLNHNKNGSSK